LAASRTHQVKLGVIGLPDLVRSVGLASVDEIVRLAVALVALVRERDHAGIDLADDRVHRRVARHRPPLALGDLDGAAMHRRDRWCRAA